MVTFFLFLNLKFNKFFQVTFSLNKWSIYPVEISYRVIQFQDFFKHLFNEQKNKQMKNNDPQYNLYKREKKQNQNKSFTVILCNI